MKCSRYSDSCKNMQILTHFLRAAILGLKDSIWAARICSFQDFTHEIFKL